MLLPRSKEVPTRSPDVVSRPASTAVPTVLPTLPDTPPRPGIDASPPTSVSTEPDVVPYRWFICSLYDSCVWPSTMFQPHSVPVSLPSSTELDSLVLYSVPELSGDAAASLEPVSPVS